MNRGNTLNPMRPRETGIVVQPLSHLLRCKSMYRSSSSLPPSSNPQLPSSLLPTRSAQLSHLHAASGSVIPTI